MQGDPKTMQLDPHYEEVVGEVSDYLAAKLEWARSIGVSETWIDPGLGFGKTKEQNMALLRATRRFVELGAPVLIGASRKGFLTEFMEPELRLSPPPPKERVSESVQAALMAVKGGAGIVRVHDVKATKVALDSFYEADNA
jgi:dihydropteroate synthase